MTESGPNQYLNTESVIISNYDINTIDFNYVDVFRTEIKGIQCPSTESKN